MGYPKGLHRVSQQDMCTPFQATVTMVETPLQGHFLRASWIIGLFPSSSGAHAGVESAQIWDLIRQVAHQAARREPEHYYMATESNRGPRAFCLIAVGRPRNPAQSRSGASFISIRAILGTPFYSVTSRMADVQCKSVHGACDGVSIFSVPCKLPSTCQYVNTSG